MRWRERKVKSDGGTEKNEGGKVEAKSGLILLQKYVYKNT